MTTMSDHTFWLGIEGEPFRYGATFITRCRILSPEEVAERDRDFEHGSGWTRHEYPPVERTGDAVRGTFWGLAADTGVLEATFPRPLTLGEPEPDDPAAESVAAALRAHGEEGG